MRKRDVVLALALAIPVLVVSPAVAAKATKHTAQLTITFLANVDQFAKDDMSGTLKTTRRCRNERKVRVFRVEPGKNPRITTARTDDEAFWHRALRTPGGRHYAKVNRDVRRWRGKKHICQGDRSRTISIPEL